MKQLAVEAGLVVLVGAVVSLAANWFSPLGLSLHRDYFHGARPLPPKPPTSNIVAAVSGTNAQAMTPAEMIVARLKEKGLQVADSNQVIQVFRDPRYEQEFLIFVDARDDRHYQEGHVPGAYQLDHYRPADYLAAVLGACQTAEKIVVYCNGGGCEDSEFAAITLRDTGVPKEKLLIYPGGFAEWATNGLPVEIGPRKSGVLKEGKK